MKYAYAFMIVAAVSNLGYAFALPPSLPWAVLPIFVYAVGTAMAMPSISLIVLDLFPARRGMAASLQGFISGVVNAVTAGVISPAVSHSPRALAVAMIVLMASGLASWLLFVKSSHGRAKHG
jgi:DHA1 family bicyclomycin/chloramphenicol resistance-like MFS transporter